MTIDSPARRVDDRPEQPAWMTMFGDLISLLLTFFVMLFAMTTIDLGKWNEVVATISTRPVPDGAGAAATRGADANIAAPVNRWASNLDYLAGVLSAQIAAEPALAGTRLLRLDDRLVITLPADLLFDSGSALVKLRGEAALFALGGALRNIGNQIDVQGHSDPNPIRSATSFASNWELSLTRAAAVADGLRRAGYPRQPGIFSFADGRFGDLDAIEPPSRRLQLARRVDVVVRPIRATTPRIDP